MLLFPYSLLSWNLKLTKLTRTGLLLTIPSTGITCPSCRAFEYKCEEILFLLLHLVDKVVFKGQRENVYDFIDYGDYIKSFIKNIFSIQKELKKCLKKGRNKL